MELSGLFNVRRRSLTKLFSWNNSAFSFLMTMYSSPKLSSNSLLALFVSIFSFFYIDKNLSLNDRFDIVITLIMQLDYH